MNKNSKSERKQTVTLTIGPKSWALLKARQQGMNKSYPGLDIAITTILAGMAAQVLNDLRDPPSKPGSENWLCLLD